MKNILIIFLLFISCPNVFAQDELTKELKSLIDQKQFDKIISEHASKTDNYSAKALYYVGLAYYMKEDDQNCIRFMDMSIRKDANDPEAHFIKASTLNYMKKYDEAVKYFHVAITLRPNDCEYYTGLGDAYYNLGKRDDALTAYLIATRQTPQCERPFIMVPQLYSELNQKDSALKYYYIARSGLTKESPSYPNVLFNIGVIELGYEHYREAEMAFIEMVQIMPEDYHSYAKLVQVYYGTKQYASAKQYKDELYSAYQKGLLTGNLKDMYCFDQFSWKDKQIQAFERFQEGPSTDIYMKHLFYVVDKHDNIAFRIQTEYSPVSVENGGAKYLLCMTKGNKHYTYHIGFNDNFEYDDLKKSVIDVLEGKLKPVASSAGGQK